VLHDLNVPIPSALEGQYSMVIESGLLEHVFDFPTAIRNCMRMVRPGGHLMLNLPVNNYPGHGFYQFSPELPFRVLAPRFGFCIREAVVRDVHRPWPGWFRVKDPAQLGRRLQFRSHSRTTMFVLAERIGPVPEFVPPPAQSDYVVAWERSDGRASVPAENQGRSMASPTRAPHGASASALGTRVSQRTRSVISEKTPERIKGATRRAQRSARVRLKRSRRAYRFRVWAVWAVPRLGKHPHYAKARRGFEPVHEPWTAPAPSARRRARHMNTALPARFPRP
jgi:hypothetical protein